MTFSHLFIPAIYCTPKPRQTCLTFSTSIHVGYSSTHSTVTPVECQISGLKTGVELCDCPTISIINLLPETHLLAQKFDSIIALKLIFGGYRLPNFVDVLIRQATECLLDTP